MVLVQQMEADDTGRQRVPGLLDDSQAVIAHPHPPQPLQPADGSLYYPTHPAQAAAMFCPPPGAVRLDPQPARQPAGLVTVVSPVAGPVGGQFLRASPLAAAL